MYIKDWPDITEKQEEIVGLIFKFRFMNRKQIQIILGHKDTHRINVWLKDLVEKNFLGRIYSHKLLENTKPAIYYLHNNGILWSKIRMGEKYGQDDLEPRAVKKFYADKIASQTFITHSIAICDLYLQFKALEDEPWEYEYITKTEQWTVQYKDNDFEERKQYIPDVLVQKLTRDWETMETSMLEIFPPYIPKYALEYKARQYITLRTEENWKRYIDCFEKTFPQIMFILPNQRKLNQLATHIQDTLNEEYDVEDMQFMLTTYKKAMEQGIADKKIWKVIKQEVD